MSISTYTDLVSNIADWLNRDDATDTRCQTFIQMAEQDIARRLRSRINEKQVTFTIDTVTPAYTLPADLLEIKDIYNENDDAPPPERISLQEFKKFGAVTVGALGWPVYFARDNDDLVFYPVTQSITMALTYYFKPAALTQAAPANDLLTAAPDIYLYGALAMGEMFFNVPMADRQYANLYDDAVNSANGADRIAEYAGSTMTMGNPYG